MLMEEVLDSLLVDSLKALARKAGLPKSLTRKGELVAALAGYVQSSQDDFLSRLTDQEQTFLAEAAHNGGHVDPEDVSAVALPALRHRVLLNFEGEAEGTSVDELIGMILESVSKVSEAAQAHLG